VHRWPFLTVDEKTDRHRNYGDPPVAISPFQGGPYSPHPVYRRPAAKRGRASKPRDPGPKKRDAAGGTGRPSTPRQLGEAKYEHQVAQTGDLGVISPQVCSVPRFHGGFLCRWHVAAQVWLAVSPTRGQGRTVGFVRNGSQRMRSHQPIVGSAGVQAQGSTGQPTGWCSRLHRRVHPSARPPPEPGTDCHVRGVHCGDRWAEGGEPTLRSAGRVQVVSAVQGLACGAAVKGWVRAQRDGTFDGATCQAGDEQVEAGEQRGTVSVAVGGGVSHRGPEASFAEACTGLYSVSVGRAPGLPVLTGGGLDRAARPVRR